MKQSIEKQLLQSQQGELDAVLLYRQLSLLVKTDSLKSQLLSVAADEGHHAAILKEYTGKILTPKTTKAKLITTLYKILGQRITFTLMSKGEQNAVLPYERLLKQYPNIQQIIQDEIRHARILSNAAKTS